ncbi:MAG: peptide chain release factor N(5)-glutamine methyltransferase [Candidatus Magasanikbacteria bacterium]|nr:peptide chain release factor N(5)-glutamine methyltransferase [Candidatus Magasanikbacteria bacterium]
MPLTTIKQLLQQAYKQIDPLDAELLLAFVLKKTREFVLAHNDCEVRKCVSVKVRKLIKKRANGMPLAYLVGHKEFFGLDFVVNKSVLIPRPETEILVENVLSFIIHHLSHNKRVVLIDVGTGSGCIPIAITSALKHFSTLAPKIFAIDVSEHALRVAKLNAKKHGVKINFLHGNLLQPIANNLTVEQFDSGTIIITANLPYLTPKQHQQSASINHEPKTALVAGKTGLELYEKLLGQIRSLITNYQLLMTIFFEIDPAQSKPVTKLIKKFLPNAEIQIKKDLAGLDRVVTTQT